MPCDGSVNQTSAACEYLLFVLMLEGFDARDNRLAGAPRLTDGCVMLHSLLNASQLIRAA